jgi:2-pyrone-4,6-dicarboxylate lactonase
VSAKVARSPVAIPSKPAYGPPPGTCDAHGHVFGPPQRFPHAEGRPYTPSEPAPRERLARLHARLGLARAVVVQATPHGTDNAAMLDAIAKSGGACRGVALVDLFARIDDDPALQRNITVDNPTRLYWGKA